MNATRTLEPHEIDAVAGGSGFNYNTFNIYSGNGGASGGALALNLLGGRQSNYVSTGNANGSATGAGSVSNSGTLFMLGGLIR